MDECAENSTLCENGKFCDNTPGSHVCRGTVNMCFRSWGKDLVSELWLNFAEVVNKSCEVYFVCKFSCGLLTSCVVISVCHSACETCIGEGSQGCTKCNTGYKMADNECKGKATTKFLLLLILGLIHHEILLTSWLDASQPVRLPPDWVVWVWAGQGHCVVFLGETFYSHSASLHLGACVNRYWQI